MFVSATPPSVSALTLGGVALSITDENLLGRIFFRGVGCFWLGGMKLADPVFYECQWLGVH